MNNKLDLQKKNNLQYKNNIFHNRNSEFSSWASSGQIVQHSLETQNRVFELVEFLKIKGCIENDTEAYELFKSADIIANAAMWLVVHMTYVKNVYLYGRSLETADFKETPEGHTGGSLNMVPAYVGYLLANALTGKTRGWMMGQGHCVAAIDAVNLLVDNLLPSQSERYDVSDSGLSQLTQDFYSYKISRDGRPEMPIGSHVNPNTAGGIIEGGYLGFAELYYPHVPLKGESLVAFLSDGAFEEQRGSDWAPRWWRAKDTGLISPFMIANGRRIDQRTTMAQTGGVKWFEDHLELNGFLPIHVDGRDPASFAWAIISMEEHYQAIDESISEQENNYPILMPYAIAETEKGFGFPGAGSNNSHNLPIDNPFLSDEARKLFNQGAGKLWNSQEKLKFAKDRLKNHKKTNRVPEKEHPFVNRNPKKPVLPQPQLKEVGKHYSSMEGVDDFFSDLVAKNPNHRFRVGNPDELRSNRMNKTLDVLKHRVTSPEDGIAEDLHGSVITALNEEAVVSAALANKAGINIAVSYEAFAVKMLGAIRQEIIWTRHQIELGQTPNWISVPIVSTSHTWENGKNEQSHQDPTLCEALLGEMSDVSRVVFPADWNSSVSLFKEIYSTRGQIWNVVAAKNKTLQFFDDSGSLDLAEKGAYVLKKANCPLVELTAIGSYQLEQVMLASKVLSSLNIEHSVIYMQEPGRFRIPRDEFEKKFVYTDEMMSTFYNPSVENRVFVSHCRPETISGVLRRLDKGINHCRFVGYTNRGGTLNTQGMLFANKITWAHVLINVAELLEISPVDFLNKEQISACMGEIDNPLKYLF